jgi:hypothetical protein
MLKLNERLRFGWAIRNLVLVANNQNTG